MSRGARRCLDALRWYAARFDEVFPYQKTIAKKLGKSEPQVRRYVLELKRAGLLRVVKQGRGPASYRLLEVAAEQRVTEKNDRSMSGRVSGRRAVEARRSIIEFKSSGNREQAGARAQFAEELKALVNGYRDPAGRWIGGCSRVLLEDGAVLDAVVAVCLERGLSAALVARKWAWLAPGLVRRAARAESPERYLRAAIVGELSRVAEAPPATEQPRAAVPVVDEPGELAAWTEEVSAPDSLAIAAAPVDRCGRCGGDGIVRAAEDRQLFAWCGCAAADRVRAERPMAVAEANAVVWKLRDAFRPSTGQMRVNVRGNAEAVGRAS